MRTKLIKAGSFVIFLVAQLASGISLQDNLELSTSVSQAYDSRSLFTNPAALGFQTELNGAGLLSSFSYGVNKTFTDEFSVGFAWGYLGLGGERISSSDGIFTRYSIGLGVPITPAWYVGTRYSFTRSDTGLLNNYNSLDLGLQYRAFSFLSFGLIAVSLNQPDFAGAKAPTKLILGSTVRPIPRLDLSVDVDTSTDAFAKTFGYEISAGAEVLRGLKVRAGYHNRYLFQVGLQFNFDRMSIYSVGQPGSPDRSLLAGAQFALHPYPTAAQPRSVLSLEINGILEEESVHGGLFSRDRPSLLETLETLEKAERDSSIVKVLIKLESFPLGLASAQDLHNALWKLRNSGKEVIVFLGNAGIKEYLIASAAQTIYLEPSGELRFLGLRSERYYLKGTLDKIGIEGEFLARGEYKSAPEMFTRKGSSPQSKEATLSELKQAETELVQLLARTRNIDASTWKDLTHKAFLSAPDALTAKLVDKIGGYSEVADKTGQTLAIKDSLREQSDQLALPQRIAIITASGDILQNRVTLLSLGGVAQVTPARVGRHFRQALSDPRTKAIVFRVSSPGGEILASEEIASIVKQARKEKPVIISMGDVAASGGYMISAPGEKIFAQPLTITGSIGVFLGKFNLGNLYKKLELQKEILTHAPYAGILSEDRPWTAEERAILLRRLNQYYDGFVNYVSESRHISLEAAEKAAKGRVWLGQEAKNLSLVDESGGLLDAIHFAAKRVGLEPSNCEYWAVQDSKGLFDLFGDEGMLFSKSPLKDLSFLAPSLAREIHWVSSLKTRPFLYLLPRSVIE